MRVRSIIVLVVCALALVGCDYLWASHWNYRITVEVITPEGHKSGSAVRRVDAWLQPQFPNPDMSPVVHKVTGEAVAVNLGERGVLFALIDWSSYNDVYSAIQGPGTTLSERLKFYRTLPPGTKGYLTPDSYPEFATFTDLSDPKSLKTVDSKSLHEVFGEGVRFKEITIEITREPVTWAIEKLVPKFGRVPRPIGFDRFKKGE